MGGSGGLKILFLNPFFWPYQGGIEWHVYMLARELRKMGHDVGVVCSDTGGKPPDRDLNVQVLPSYGMKLPFYSPPTFYVTPHIADLVAERARDFDLVHLHNRWYPDYALSLIGVSKAKPAFFTAHEPLSRSMDAANSAFTRAYNDVITRRIAKASTIMAVSRYVADGFREAYGNDVPVVHNGVDAKRIFTPGGKNDRLFREKFGIDGDYILFVGRAVPDKGLKHLLRAFAALDDKRLRLVLISRGSEELALKIQARYLGIHERFRFIDAHVAEDELVSAYRSCLFFVLPSIWEAFGIVALEAMACGKAVLASDVDGIPEVVGDAGVLVPPADPAALREGMERLLADGRLRSRLGKAGRKRALEKFSWAEVARRTLAAYKKKA